MKIERFEDAEGFDSETNREFVRFLRYAKRSCTEVQSEPYLAMDQQYIIKAEFYRENTTPNTGI